MPCPARTLRGGGDWLRSKSLFSGNSWIKGPRGAFGYCPPRACLWGATLRDFVLGLGRRLRWWSFGAFGSKGCQEGAQYLAGRRAPPLLCR